MVEKNKYGVIEKRRLFKAFYLKHYLKDEYFADVKLWKNYITVNFSNVDFAITESEQRSIQVELEMAFGRISKILAKAQAKNDIVKLEKFGDENGLEEV
jgi:hypothetical protein